MLEKVIYKRLLSDVDIISFVYFVIFVSWLLLLFFWWMNGIFRMGNERFLVYFDILFFYEEDKVRDLIESFQKEWNKYVNEFNKNKECKV